VASRWKVTVRSGSDVSREGFDDLDEALAAAEKAVDEALADGPLPTVKAFRDYTPDQLVKARIEVAGKGFFSPPVAGVDVHGDGGMLAFSGGVRRKPLEADDRRQIFSAMRAVLER
jgi:hypothetical protein